MRYPLTLFIPTMLLAFCQPVHAQHYLGAEGGGGGPVVAN
jgi:hypothetical protein